MDAIRILPVENGVEIAVKAVPGASRTALAGPLDGRLKVRLAVAAHKGEANRCLAKYLAELFGVNTGAVRIVRGQSSPFKQIIITGISVEQARERISKAI